MKSKKIFLYCWIVLLSDALQTRGLNGEKLDEKLRVCIVESRGAYRKTAKYCPKLEQTSNIECVIGLDRLDCLRRIHKGHAHFGVFSSEDLVAARWAGIEILITNELRFQNSPFEYEIVAVVDNGADINSAHDLRGAKLCHPGHGLQNPYTDILANYFESTLVERQCNEDISLTELKIKASADFFGPSCKAGPWVPDPKQDRILKKRYPSLCELCYTPQTCDVGDKHWGRMGPLYCLTGGEGEVAWVRLDDVKMYFGFSGLPAETDPSLYSYLCPDGHLQPLSTQKPCVWVAKPWPAIAVKRNYAETIQNLLVKLSHDEQLSWQNSLLSLLESYHVNITTLDNSIPIDDYLDQAVGFQSAYSFATCSPPRSIVYCTTSLIQHYKCSWLQEASSVYGIEPNIQCIRTESLERCMDDTQHKVVDVVLVNQDERIQAEREFRLKPLLYEYSKDIQDRYVVLAVVSKQSNIFSIKDLRGKRACFPSYEGAAYLSVMETLLNSSLISSNCPSYASKIDDFFAPNSCMGKLDQCDQKYDGEVGALRCLADGKADVAFVSSEVFEKLVNRTIKETWTEQLKSDSIKLLCPFGKGLKTDKYCYLHWAPRGNLMINRQTPLVRQNEIYNSLRDMDKLFGKQSKSHTIPFTMFGPFDKKNNVMFQDKTDGLRGLVELEKDKSQQRLLEQTYERYSSQICLSSGANSNYSFRIVLGNTSTIVTIILLFNRTFL